MTCGSETYRADRRRDPKRLTASLSGNLNKLWNRLLSGSYFPSPVRRVEIPKASGETRPLAFGKHHPHSQRQEHDVNATESDSEEGQTGSHGAIYLVGASLTASPRKSPGASFTPGQQCRSCQMSRAGELLERKQGLLDRMQKEPGAIDRSEIEQALKAINEALNRLESEQLDAPVPHH
jgi:hypothetical protein